MVEDQRRLRAAVGQKEELARRAGAARPGSSSAESRTAGGETQARRSYTRSMREHDLELLELPAVLARLAAATASEPGPTLAEALRPSPDADVVRLRQQQTSEAISLIEDSAELDLGGATDVSEAAELAGRGSTLDTRTPPGHRADDPARRRGRRATRRPEGLPALTDLVAWIDTAALRRRRDRAAVEPDGSDLRDAASPRLRGLRRGCAVRRQAAERLQDRARRAEGAPAGDFVTERGGRPVLAVKASARARCRGSSTTRPARGRRCSSSRSRSSSDQPAAGGRDRRARRGRADPGKLSSLVGARRTVPQSSTAGSSTSRSRAAGSRAAGAARS